ncbi:MAG: hypothetical protein QG577_2116 [Thermodesulfobacteriota bacterium]|nr:hypothetical protein [Thermodesulfobacteriota bacterium]
MVRQKSSHRRIISPSERAFVCLMLLLLILSAVIVWVPDGAANQSEDSLGPKRMLNDTTAAYGKDAPTSQDLSPEERIARIEDALESIRATGEKAEDRSYYNKMMSMELVRYVRIMVGVLIAIAILFPLTLWLLSKKRLIGLSGLSTEVTATLLMVEERQAKLANLLRDIQQEVDYMQNMSGPDLKKLIEQAEKYLNQNERDLKTTGAAPPKRDLD